MKSKAAVAVLAISTAAGLWAASGVIELEIPDMNEATAAAINDCRTNPCPQTVAVMRSSIATNYDGVVQRKADKRDDLQAEADNLAAELEEMIATNATKTAISRQQKLIEERQALVDEMTDIVDDMIEFKWYRVEQNVVRFTDPRFGRKHDGDYRYNEPDADGFIPLLGAATDLSIAYTHVTNAAYAAFDPSHTYPVGEEGHPVVNVSYEDAVRYCEWLTDNSTDYTYKYRLPTEAEWELAAGHMPKDASINAANVESGTTDVFAYFEEYGDGAKSLSGTLDMWGNAWEWLATAGDDDGTMKIKGGAYDEDRSQCRTEERGNWRDMTQGYSNIGFRILREKNKAAAVINDSNSSRWISRYFNKTLVASQWRELENDTDGDGFTDWQEYVALTDPTNSASFLQATIEIGSDGVASVGLKTEVPNSRKYTTYGKESLDDSVWLEVGDNAALYRFFKVDVDLPSLISR